MLEKGSEPGAHILSRRDHGSARAQRAVPRLEGTRRAAEPAGHRRPLPVPHRDRRDGDAALLAARLLPQRRQLRHQPRQRRALAGAAGRSAGRRDLPRLRRRPRCSTTTTARSAASPPATSASARTASRPTNFQLGMELHAKYTIFAEGARGHLGQQLIAHFKLDDGTRSAELRHRHQGAVGSSTRRRPSPAWWCTPPAGRWTTTTYGGSFLYHLEDNQVDARLRRRPRLQQPVPEPVRGIAALEDAPRDPEDARRRQAPRLRRARDHRRRHPEPAEDGVPGRRAGRLRCRLPERQPHQGQPCGDQDRHAGRRGGLRRARRRPPARRARSPIPAAFEKSWLHAELRQVAQLQAVVQEGRSWSAR